MSKKRRKPRVIKLTTETDSPNVESIAKVKKEGKGVDSLDLLLSQALARKVGSDNRDTLLQQQLTQVLILREYRWFHRKEDPEVSKGEWRKYNHEGYWELISSSEAENIIDQTLINNNFDLKNYHHIAIKIARNALDTEPAEYDPSDMYLIKELKVVDCKNHTIIPYNPSVHKFTRIVPRHLVVVDRYSKAIIENIFLHIPAPHSLKNKYGKKVGNPVRIFNNPIPTSLYCDQRLILQRWLGNFVWHDRHDLLALMLVGNPNASKTPIANVVYDLLMPLSGSFHFSKLGEKGELATVMGKWVGVENEGNGGRFDKDTCALLKNLLSDTFKIPVRLLYHNPVEMEVNLMLCVSSNRLPLLDEAFENDAIYKRLAILFCPNQFIKCNALADLFRSTWDDSTTPGEPGFLDELFSYLITMPLPSPPSLTELEWWHRNEFLYFWSSQPLEWIMKELYERSYACDDSGDEIEMAVGKMAKDIDEIYQTRGLLIPRSFREQIVKEATKMGGTMRRRNGNAFIVGLNKKGETTPDDPYTVPQTAIDKMLATNTKEEKTE